MDLLEAFGQAMDTVSVRSRFRARRAEERAWPYGTASDIARATGVALRDAAYQDCLDEIMTELTKLAPLVVGAEETEVHDG